MRRCIHFFCVLLTLSLLSCTAFAQETEPFRADLKENALKYVERFTGDALPEKSVVTDAAVSNWWYNDDKSIAGAALRVTVIVPDQTEQVYLLLFSEDKTLFLVDLPKTEGSTAQLPDEAIRINTARLELSAFLDELCASPNAYEFTGDGQVETNSPEEVCFIITMKTDTDWAKANEQYRIFWNVVTTRLSSMNKQI